MPQQSSQNKTPINIAIIGAGVMGISAAVEIAKNLGDKVAITIFEKRDDILAGTSGSTPGRMGLGYHYFDKDTALLYLQYTIDFIKSFPNCIKKDDHDFKGRYFILKDSIVPLSDILSVYHEILAKFNEIAVNDKDVSDAFGGKLSHRIMAEEEYKKDVSYEKVLVGIETCEKILDFDKFKSVLKGLIEQHNIKIVYMAEISNITKSESGYVVTYKDYSKKVIGKRTFDDFADDVSFKEIKGIDKIVDCTWEASKQIIKILKNNNILTEGNLIGGSPQISTYSQRLKFLVEVRIPKSLRKMHHAFFCVGPFAMFTNQGNLTAKITYANFTNVLGSDEIETYGNDLVKKMWKSIYQKLGRNITSDEWDVMVAIRNVPKEIQKVIGDAIISGVAEFIPKMKDAKLIRILPGYILSSQKGVCNDIANKYSFIHRRTERGIDVLVANDIFSVKAMKLFGCITIARKLMDIMFPGWNEEREKEKKYQEIKNEFMHELNRLIPILHEHSNRRYLSVQIDKDDLPMEDHNIFPPKVIEYQKDVIAYMGGLSPASSKLSRLPSSISSQEPSHSQTTISRVSSSSPPLSTNSNPPDNTISGGSLLAELLMDDSQTKYSENGGRM